MQDKSRVTESLRTDSHPANPDSFILSDESVAPPNQDQHATTRCVCLSISGMVMHGFHGMTRKVDFDGCSTGSGLTVTIRTL